jgi:nicotinamidase-related amidase
MDALSTDHLAILVVDVQTGLFKTSPPPFEADLVIHRINSVTTKGRAAGVPVIFVQHQGPPDGHWLVPESEAWQLHPDLKHESGDLLIRKTTVDAFYGTNLQQTLRSRNLHSILLMGYATDFCVDSTLRNAASKEFEIFVVSDAHTTNDTQALKAAQIRAHFNYAWGESSSRRGIHLLEADRVRFAPALSKR